MFKEEGIFSGFSVDDLQKAKKFYRDILGLQVKDHPMGILELHTAGNNPILVYPKTNHEPATFTILNFPVADIDEAVKDLIEKGVTFEQYKDLNTDKKGISRNEGGPNIAWFKDPAGNILAIIETTK
jgi:catechol 2,3-dioxygenase-like lactoylglutathione lyase family enzyme